MKENIIRIYKEGEWFRCYEDDALILSYITGYKIFTDIKTNNDAVGFLDANKIIEKLNQYEINYNFEGFKNKKTFLNNHYNEILRKSIDAYYYRKNRNTKKYNKDINYNKTNTNKKIFYTEIGNKMVLPNTTITIKNINTNNIEIFNIIEPEFHYETRYKDSIYDFEHLKNIKVYENNIDILNDEISTESEFGKLIIKHKVGYKFEYRNEVFEIIDIKDYQKKN